MTASCDVEAHNELNGSANMRVGKSKSRSRTFVALAAFCLASSLWATAPVQGQTISTPAGELRIGMTEAVVTRLFQKPVYEKKADDVRILSRSLSITSGHHWFAANLTSKGVVYYIASGQWFSGGSIGQQAAEQMFREYLRDCGAPERAVDLTGDSGITLRGWETSHGLTMVIGLHCEETMLGVEVADYQRQFTDDGIRDDRQQRMGPWDRHMVLLS
jgi:hypothetical protein